MHRSGDLFPRALTTAAAWRLIDPCQLGAEVLFSLDLALKDSDQ